MSKTINLTEFKRLYPHFLNPNLALYFGVPESKIKSLAGEYGLEKTAGFTAIQLVAGYPPVNEGIEVLPEIDLPASPVPEVIAVKKAMKKSENWPKEQEDIIRTSITMKEAATRLGMDYKKVYNYAYNRSIKCEGVPKPPPIAAAPEPDEETEAEVPDIPEQPPDDFVDTRLRKEDNTALAQRKADKKKAEAVLKKAKQTTGKKTVPLRIDSKTVIMISPNDDPDEARRRYHEKHAKK